MIDKKALRRHYIKYAAKEFPFLTVTGIKSQVRVWEAKYYGIVTPVSWEYVKNHRQTVKERKG